MKNFFTIMAIVGFFWAIAAFIFDGYSTTSLTIWELVGWSLACVGVVGVFIASIINQNRGNNG